MGVEGGDDVEVGGVRRVAAKFGLCFLVVPVVSGIRCVGDMGGSRGGRGDNDVNSKVGGGSDIGFGEVGGEEVEANVSRVGEVVGDEVVGFDGDTMMGGCEVGPRGKVGAEDVEGVTDVGTEDRFVGGTAGEVVVTVGIKGAAAAAGTIGKFGREAGEVEFVLESKAVGVGREEEMSVVAGCGFEGDAGGDGGEGGEGVGDVGRGRRGKGGGEGAEVMVA